MAKKPRHRPLKFGPPKITRAPKGATHADAVRAMNDAVITGRLPQGWEISTQWSNRKDGSGMKSAPIERMLKDSGNRGGDFNGLFLNRFLAIQARKFGVDLEQPRQATEAEIRRFEEAHERIREREAGEFAELSKKQKRSAAARKGHATRKAAALKREASALKRKAAALRRKQEAEAAARKWSEAAKKAAATRAANRAAAEREAKRAAKKRSEAARKGWETRQKNAAKQRRKKR